jgi:hypothetical protein
MKQMPRSKPLIWLFLITGIGIVILGTVILLPKVLRGVAAQPSFFIGTAQVTTGTEITTLQPTISETPTQIDYFSIEQTSYAMFTLTQEAYLTSPPSTRTPGPSPTPPTYTPKPFVAGISDSQAAPLTQVYTIENWWQDIVNGEKVRVFAGGKRDNPGEPTIEVSKGILFVITVAMDESNVDYQFYEPPISDTGLLSITAVTNYRLTIQAESGAVLYFDVPTRQFVESLTATVSAPTVTPLPPITPSPTNILPCPIGGPYPPPVCANFPTPTPSPDIEP